MNTDEAWEEWGRRDPYFGVFTNKKYRRAELNETSLKEFFDSGTWHAGFVMQTIHQHVDSSFKPSSVLDFGCGVGRLLIPFAAMAQDVVGLDVSPSMLAEARKNCDERGIANVRLLESDDQLSRLTGSFDLVHSCIVFQHIPVERGRTIFRNLLERINPGGVGAVHFTYAKSVFAASFGTPPQPAISKLAQASRAIAQLASGADPEMLMISYNLNELLFMIQSAGAQQLHVQLTDHGGELGAFLYFRMPASPRQAAPV